MSTDKLNVFKLMREGRSFKEISKLIIQHKAEAPETPDKVLNRQELIRMFRETPSFKKLAQKYDIPEKVIKARFTENNLPTTVKEMKELIK